MKCDYCGKEDCKENEVCKQAVRDLDEYRKEKEEQARKDDAILKEVKKQVNEKQWKELELQMEESDGGWNFEIVDDIKEEK